MYLAPFVDFLYVTVYGTCMSLQEVFSSKSVSAIVMPLDPSPFSYSSAIFVIDFDAVVTSSSTLCNMCFSDAAIQNCVVKNFIHSF